MLSVLSRIWILIKLYRDIIVISLYKSTIIEIEDQFEPEFKPDIMHSQDLLHKM